MKRGFRLCYRRNIAENQPASSQEPPAQPLQQGPQMAGHRNFDNTARPPEKQGRLVPRWSGRHRRRHRLHPHHRGRRHHCGRQWPQPLLLQHPVNRLSITSAHRKGPCARLNGADTSRQCSPSPGRRWPTGYTPRPAPPASEKASADTAAASAWHGGWLRQGRPTPRSNVRDGGSTVTLWPGTRGAGPSGKLSSS